MAISEDGTARCLKRLRQLKPSCMLANITITVPGVLLAAQLPAACSTVKGREDLQRLRSSLKITSRMSPAGHEDVLHDLGRRARVHGHAGEAYRGQSYRVKGLQGFRV